MPLVDEVKQRHGEAGLRVRGIGAPYAKRLNEQCIWSDNAASMQDDAPDQPGTTFCILRDGSAQSQANMCSSGTVHQRSNRRRMAGYDR